MPDHRSPSRPAAATTAPAGRLTTRHILFLIVAAAAPLSAMVGTVPLAFAFGNGAGVPAAFVFAGATLLCFSVGYAISARRTGGSGGFYASTALDLGRPPAVATGYLALLAYNCATIGLAGALGYFTQIILAQHGVHVSWELCAAVGIALVALLGYREIAVSARLLALLMLGEIGILIALDLAILGKHGSAALPAASFSEHNMTGPGTGVALMFAFVSFIGFESAALYGKEAKDPRRSVPRATYGAVLLISGFYALTSWLAVGAVGTGQLRQTATNELGDLFFDLGQRYLGQTGSTCLQVLLCTSLFAATLALHSAANRYTQVLAQDGLLPAGLGAAHPKSGSPHRASVLQTVLNVVVVGAFAVAGLNPYTDLTTSMLGLGTLGIVVLQAVAALSVIVARLRGRSGNGNLLREVVVPFLGFAGLVASVLLVVDNFSMLTGTSNGLVSELPWLVVLAALFGLGYAAWLRSARRTRYDRLGTAHLMPAEDAAAPVAAPTPAPAPVAARADLLDLPDLSDAEAAMSAGAVLTPSLGESGGRHA
jgi:amino acid transporter